jgi:polar amino acid transport system substrate-binding protein
VLILTLVGLAALVGPGTSLAQSPSPSAATEPGASPEPAGSPSASTVPAVTLVSEACQAAAIDPNLKDSGRFTVSTDNPAFFPWFDGAVPEGSEWGTLGYYPPSGDGFESAIAYAVAAALGFTPDQVDWIPQAEFGLAFKPGEKDFDIHLGQVEYRPKRAERVDFSDSYFDVNQGIVALAGTPITEVTDLAGLKAFTLGAATATTSLELIETVIQPDVEPKVYRNNNAAVRALKNGQVDGLVVDLPTAFYMRDVQVNDFDTPEAEGAVLGQIATEVQSYFGILLQKDSPLTACINEALAVIKANGTWQAIYDSEISEVNDAPFLE